MANKRKNPNRSAYEDRTRRVGELAEHSVAIKKLLERFPDALTIQDATAEKMLLVTVDDVRKGTPKNPSACAVAQCAKRNGLGGMIGRMFAFLVDGHAVTRYSLGKDAQVRTAMFDDRGTTTPGPIMLSVPSPSVRLSRINRGVKMGVTARKKRDLLKSRGQKLRQAHVAKREDHIRKVMSTHGFRSWDQA